LGYCLSLSLSLLLLHELESKFVLLNLQKVV
jgi:hypothetical protein